MRVKVRVEKAQFDVPCGEGRQPVKWLGFVASQRYGMMVPHGRVRAREDSEARGDTLPADVKNKGKSIDPKALICEVFEDGAEVTVELMKVELDEIGAPKYTDWQEKALFSNGSKTSEIRRKGKESRAKIEVAEARIRSEIERRQKESRRYEEASQVVLGHLESEADVAVALELDYPHINEQRSALRDYYRELNKVYIRYAGVGKIDQPNGMTVEDYGHFIHLSKIARLRVKGSEDPCDRADIHRAFETATKQRANGLMSRAEFIKSLLQFLPLEDLMQHHIRPFLNARRGEFQVAFDSIPIQDAIQHTRPNLQRVYDAYKPMTLPALKRVLSDSGLVALVFTDDDNTEHIDKIALDVFLAVQHDPPFNLELDSLVFIEFIEAYCFVASDLLTAANKIDIALNQLADFSLIVRS